MSLTLPIITYGGGDVLREFFNAIVLSLGDQSFKTLLRLSLLLGGMGAVVDSITRRNMMLNVRFICLYILVTNLFFLPKVAVEIIDRTQAGKVYTVDHVPLGLAVMANITSVIGDSLTQLTEKNFTLPDDLRYGKTGMVMAANLVTAASHFQIIDPAFAANLQSYVQQCVFYDLLLHKYSQNDLLNTPNLWGFLRDHSSPARAFLYNNTVRVCKDGATQLNADWTAAMDATAAHYAPQVLHNSVSAKANLLSYLPTSYHFLTHLSNTAAEILQQNLLASSINDSLQQWGAATNSAAALESFAFTKAQTQKRMSNQTVGDMAAHWLPLMKTCFEGVLYGAFIFILLLALFPFGLGVLRNYLAALLWVQLWAPLYAILNLIVSFYAQSKSLALASGGLSLSALGGLAQVNADMAGLAGYLSLSVPLMAWGLVKGMGSSFIQLAQFVGGMTQSTATSSATEAVTGNLSMGNTHFGNHSQLNTHANHWDTNLRYAAGMATVQTATGAALSLTPSGSTVLDQRGALSNLAVSVNMADSLRSAASTQAQTSYTTAVSESVAAGQHYSTALRQLRDFGHQQSYSTSSGHFSSHSTSSGVTQAAHAVTQLVDSFAKDHHVSTEFAAQVLGQVYAEGKLGMHRGLFNPSGGSAGLSVTGSGSYRHGAGHLYSEAKRFASDHHISDVIDQAQRVVKESHYRDSSDDTSRAAQSINSSFDQAEQFRKEASSHFSTAHSFTTLASQTQENAAAVNANYTQAFYEWMREQPAPMGRGTLSRSALDNMAAHDPALLQSYANRFVHEKTTQSMAAFNHTTHLNQGQADVQAAYQQHTHAIDNRLHLQDQYQQFEHTINQHAASIQQTQPDPTIAQQVNATLQNNKDAFDKKQREFNPSPPTLVEEVKNKVE